MLWKLYGEGYVSALYLWNYVSYYIVLYFFCIWSYITLRLP